MQSIRTSRGRLALAGGLLGAMTLAGCSSGGGGDNDAADIPTQLKEKVKISFWHVYQGADQAGMDALIAEFEDQNPMIDVDAQFTGGFAEQNQKITSGLQAGDPANVAITYPSFTIEYLSSKMVMNLSDYVGNDAVGLSDEEVNDLFEIQRDINRYEAADGDLMSFPFTANVMVLYYNDDLLESAGIEEPPATWNEFKEQCAIIKEELNLPCYSARGDGSSINAIVGSFGGEVIDAEGQPAIDTPAWEKMLGTFEELQQAGYVEVAGGGAGQVTGPDLQSFVSQNAAFILGSSRNIGFFPDAIGDAFDWRAAAPPQEKATDKPVTVLYGPGVTGFKSGDANEDLASWLLIKYLASAEAQSIWATSTGQLPVRESVAQSPEFQQELQDNPATAVAFSLMGNTVWDGAIGPDGVIRGISSKERELLASVMNTVLLGDMTVEQAMQQLQAGIGN